MDFGKSVEPRTFSTLHFCLSFRTLLPWFIELSTGSQMFDDSGRESDVSGKDVARSMDVLVVCLSYNGQVRQLVTVC
jgi:hypothetical protein